MSKTEKKFVRSENEQIEISNIIMKELNYFSTVAGEFELKFSQEVIASNGNVDITKKSEEIKALPRATKEEKDFRRKMLALIKDFKVAKKARASAAYQTAQNFDYAIFAELFKTSDRVTEQIRDVQNQIKNSSSGNEKLLKSQLKALYGERNAVDRKIKETRKKYIYCL